MPRHTIITAASIFQCSSSLLLVLAMLCCVDSARAATDCHNYLVNTNVTQALLSSRVQPPCTEVVRLDTSGFPNPLDSLQHGFDLYSWLTFVALNSPADAKSNFGPNVPTVWESWKQLTDVMLPNGDKPEWTSPHVVPEACRSKAGSETMIVQMMDESFNQPFKSGPLIDQDGDYALFVIFMNKPMFDYIVENGLYSQRGQMNFTGPVDFPSGSKSGDGTLGAVMVKASWKVLKDDRDADFHTIKALVYTPASEDGKIPATCEVRKLGLVGFHVGHKTENRQQWVWTTFEHIRNVPTQADVDAKRVNGRYNFYDPSCPASKCPVNQTPPWPWDPHNPPSGFKSQITRVVPPSEDAMKINTAARSTPGVSGSVWSNYMLVSTQWPSDFSCASDKDPHAHPDPTCAPAPVFLANTTLETFSQEQPTSRQGVPLASSSCISCHNNATTHHVQATPSDFTFILEKAH